MEKNRRTSDALSVSVRKRDVNWSNLTVLVTGVLFMVMGAFAYVAKLNPAVALILVAFGILGILITGPKGLHEKEGRTGSSN